jgi:hypothetical protein
MAEPKMTFRKMVLGYHYTDGETVGVYTVDCENCATSGAHTQRPMVQLAVTHQDSQIIREWFAVADLKEVD